MSISAPNSIRVRRRSHALVKTSLSASIFRVARNESLSLPSGEEPSFTSVNLAWRLRSRGAISERGRKIASNAEQLQTNPLDCATGGAHENSAAGVQAPDRVLVRETRSTPGATD
jgi:hypothetical protein